MTSPRLWPRLEPAVIRSEEIPLIANTALVRASDLPVAEPLTPDDRRQEVDQVVVRGAGDRRRVRDQMLRLGCSGPGPPVDRPNELGRVHVRHETVDLQLVLVPRHLDHARVVCLATLPAPDRTVRLECIDVAGEDRRLAFEILTGAP